jgi:hypothetical protein
MDSVVVHLRDATEKQVTDFLGCAYPFQQGPPWIFEQSGDACLYINVYSEARQEYEPQVWAGVVAALGAEPTVSVIADVSGRHKGEGQERVFVRTMLSQFRGVALDEYTDYCWTLEDIISGKRIKGHSFFDAPGWWYSERSRTKGWNR